MWKGISWKCSLTLRPCSPTRIIIINGHREIGLDLAGRYVLRKSLVVAIKSKLPYKLSLHKSKTEVDFHFKWPFDCSKKSTLAIKMIQKV